LKLPPLAGPGAIPGGDEGTHKTGILCYQLKKTEILFFTKVRQKSDMQDWRNTR
jgi:hypothetical protein